MAHDFIKHATPISGRTETELSCLLSCPLYCSLSCPLSFILFDSLFILFLLACTVVQLQGAIPDGAVAHPLHDLHNALPGTVGKRTRSHVNRQHLTLDDLDMLSYDDAMVMDGEGDTELGDFLVQLQRTAQTSDTEGSEQDDADYDHTADERKHGNGETDEDEFLDPQVEAGELAALDKQAAARCPPKRRAPQPGGAAVIKRSRQAKAPTSQFDYFRKFAPPPEPSCYTPEQIELYKVQQRQFYQLLLQCHVACSGHALFSETIVDSRELLQQTVTDEIGHHSANDGLAAIPASVLRKADEVIRCVKNRRFMFSFSYYVPHC